MKEFFRFSLVFLAMNFVVGCLQQKNVDSPSEELLNSNLTVEEYYSDTLRNDEIILARIQRSGFVSAGKAYKKDCKVKWDGEINYSQTVYDAQAGEPMEDNIVKNITNEELDQLKVILSSRIENKVKIVRKNHGCPTDGDVNLLIARRLQQDKGYIYLDNLELEKFNKSEKRLECLQLTLDAAVKLKLTNLLDKYCTIE